MQTRWAIAAVLGAITGLLHASDTEPSLGLALPLEQREDGVYVTENILASGSIVIPAGAQAKVAFLIPSNDDPALSRQTSNEKLQETFSRQPSKLASQSQDPTPAERYRSLLEETAAKNSWKELVKFQAIFHTFEHEKLILAVKRPDQEKLQLIQFEFPQGLFLAEKNGGVAVLAVQKGSAADTAGIAAPSYIRTINGSPAGSTLHEFTDLYYKTIEATEKTGEALKFGVSELPDGTVKEVSLSLPKSLKTDLWSDVLPK